MERQIPVAIRGFTRVKRATDPTDPRTSSLRSEKSCADIARSVVRLPVRPTSVLGLLIRGGDRGRQQVQGDVAADSGCVRSNRIEQ
jgi:hypothetical protein